MTAHPERLKALSAAGRIKTLVAEWRKDPVHRDTIPLSKEAEAFVAARCLCATQLEPILFLLREESTRMRAEVIEECGQTAKQAVNHYDREHDEDEPVYFDGLGDDVRSAVLALAVHP